MTRTQWLRTAAFSAAFAVTAIAADRATITGRVVDAAGKPVEHATVLVYAAGVKSGYSTYCPTCYVDCGKRAYTAADGSYKIVGVDPALWFRLMVAHDGFTPAFAMKVDPAQGAADNVQLAARPAVTDPTRVVSGRVVDDHGLPVRDAIVRPQGVATRNNNGRYIYDGNLRDADPVATTNAQGEFQLAFARPAAAMVLMVEGRGLAPKRFFDVFTGPDRTSLALAGGSTVRGRLVQNGQPVAGAEMGLFTRVNMGLRGYDEMRIGTQPDGTFVIANIPATEYFLYPKMESLASRGAAAPIPISVKADGDDIDVGDIQVVPGLRMRGRIVLTDGNAIPEGMRVSISSSCQYCDEVKRLKESFGESLDREFQLRNTQTLPLGPDGKFEFGGLAPGPYTLNVQVKGYTPSAGFSTLLPADPSEEGDNYWKYLVPESDKQLRMLSLVETRVTGNVDNLVVKLDPIGAK